MVGAWNPPSNGNTIEAFADAARSVRQASAPSNRRGGELLEDEQIASLTGGNASPTESGRSVLHSYGDPSLGANSTSAVPALLTLPVVLLLHLPKPRVLQQLDLVLRLLVPLAPRPLLRQEPVASPWQ